MCIQIKQLLLLFFMAFATPVVTWSLFVLIANQFYSMLTLTKCSTVNNQQTSISVYIMVPIHSIKPPHVNWRSPVVGKL